MVLDTSLSILEFSLNTGFMIISLVILGIFIRRFEGNLQITRANISGFILMALGLSFHILGNLIAQLLAEDQQFQDSASRHYLAAFISFSVVIFVIGTALILYHISSDKNRTYVRLFAIIYLVLGLLDTLYHFLFLFLGEDFQLMGADPDNIELIYLILVMISLIVIYIFMYLQANKTPSRVVGVRYRLLSVTALGFVIVIAVDSVIRLGYLGFEQTITFFIFFILHVITVGALYLLVLFPEWFQRAIGLSDQSI